MAPRTFPIVRVLNLLRQPVVIVFGGAGIFNLLAITYAFQPRFRDRLTQGRRALPWKPWVFGEGDFRPLYRLLMPCIITCIRSNAPYGTSSAQIQRSPTTYSFQNKSVISALCFQSRLLSAQSFSIGELLRTL